MKTRVIVGLGAGVVGIVAAALFFSESPREREVVATPPATAQAQAPAPAPAVPAPSSCGFQPDTRLTYAVRVESKTKQSTPGMAQPTALSLSMSGLLHAEVRSMSATSTVLVGKLALSATPATSVDTEALRAPFLLEVDGQCQLLNFARRKTSAPASARNQQALLWETQFRLGAVGAYRMQDANGVALGRLEHSAGRLHRTLERYESLWADAPAELAMYGVMGVELGSGPWFASLEASSDQTAAQFTTSTTTSLERRAPSGVFDASERDQSAYVWENLLPRQAKPHVVGRPITKFDRARQAKVANQTLDTALEGFTERVNKGLGTQSTWPDLSAYFEVHPDAVQPAIAKYMKGELPPRAAGDFFLALSKARVPEARDALLAIKRNDGAVMMDQVRAMFGLVTREDVGHELATELAGDVRKNAAKRSHDHDFLAGEAMLALSTMSGIRDDAAIAATSRQALEETVGTAPPNSQNLRVALHAIGNTGDPGMLPMVGGYMNDSDVDTRKAAAHAFSRMPAAESDALELAWLQRETNPFVKKEMYRVFQQQHLDLHQGASRALVEHVLTELPTVKAAYTRKHMVLLVAQSSVAQEPDIRRRLVEQAKWERARGTVLLNQFATILTRDEIAEVLR